ncbi:lipid kinase [Tamlana sp. s12]|uniref:diacylglycerol/lipid kinase family protein n=1 Tax=Tamlana sp. s12 TaxID=1630406 RepID=UPI0007FD2BA0|nr:diacylglycerol kinase family protein [Tamlana sp. s12]OBQ56697.1 diacylglycerol kinase [Tamlana sp. s12]QQY81657.1 lipid kinase [Tamlana sp. s12]
MKLLIVLNPISGNIDKKSFVRKVKDTCKYYGISYKIYKTTGHDDLKQLIETLKTFNPDRVASIGGDGTTLLTALSILNTKIPMGIVPLGSANGMAEELAINNTPIEAFKDLLTTQITGKLDIIEVNNKHYSIHIGDVGLNAQIVANYEADEQRGMITYAKYFFDSLKNTQPFSIEVHANGKTIKREIVMVAICNARKYGTGVPLNLHGSPMDGKFELVLISNINVNSIIRAGLSKFDENFYANNNVEIISTQQAQLQFEKALKLQLDGEVIGSFKHLDINILEGAVNLLTTANNPYLK